MITVYKRKCIPKGTKLILLNDLYFDSVTSDRLDERAKTFIREIDRSEMLDKYSIRSRFDGTRLNIDKLSSGCKTVLNVFYNPDEVFDVRECGDNALDAIYSLERGKIFCDYPVISFSMKSVIAHGKNAERIISDYEELKAWWQNAD